MRSLRKRAVTSADGRTAGATPQRVACFALALALGFTSAGCYTLLSHPAVDPTAMADDGGTCSQCHDGGAPNASDASTWQPWQEPYISSSSPWIVYYGQPWWQNWRWHRAEVAKDDNDDPQKEPSGRIGWGRVPAGADRAEDPVTMERGASLPPSIPGPAPGVRSTPEVSPAPAPAATGDVTTPPATEEPEKPEEKPKDQPTGRRTLRR